MKNHLKRLAAPKTWQLLRKEHTYVARPRPGKPFKLAMPLVHVMTTLLGKGHTRKEVRYILFSSPVLLNGRRVYDHRTPVGFTDVLEFSETGEYFVIGLSEMARLKAVPITKEQAQMRLVQISNKTRHKGKFQINCTDGTNILVDKNAYATGDTLVLASKKIKKHLALKEGMTIILTGGSHFGQIGTVTKLSNDTVVFKTKDAELSTAKRYAFVIGEKSAEVPLQ